MLPFLPLSPFCFCYHNLERLLAFHVCTSQVLTYYKKIKRDIVKEREKRDVYVDKEQEYITSFTVNGRLTPHVTVQYKVARRLLLSSRHISVTQREVLHVEMTRNRLWLCV